MSSSAHIFYDSSLHTVTLQTVAEVISAETRWRVEIAEWRGSGLVIPQLLVLTAIPFLIQIENDPTWVPQENLEFGEWAGLSKNSAVFAQLGKCDARLAIQSTQPDQVTIGEGSLVVSTLGTAVDPSNPAIAAVLAVVGRKINGLLNDCVNGGLTPCL